MPRAIEILHQHIINLDLLVHDSRRIRAHPYLPAGFVSPAQAMNRMKVQLLAFGQGIAQPQRAQHHIAREVLRAWLGLIRAILRQVDMQQAPAPRLWLAWRAPEYRSRSRRPRLTRPGAGCPLLHMQGHQVGRPIHFDADIRHRWRTQHLFAYIVRGPARNM